MSHLPETDDAHTRITRSPEGHITQLDIYAPASIPPDQDHVLLDFDALNRAHPSLTIGDVYYDPHLESEATLPPKKAVGTEVILFAGSVIFGPHTTWHPHPVQVIAHIGRIPDHTVVTVVKKEKWVR